MFKSIIKKYWIWYYRLEVTKLQIYPEFKLDTKDDNLIIKFAKKMTGFEHCVQLFAPEDYQEHKLATALGWCDENCNKSFHYFNIKNFRGMVVTRWTIEYYFIFKSKEDAFAFQIFVN